MLRIMQFVFFLLISSALAFIDLYSKTFFQILLREENIVIWKDFLLTLKYNDGIAFSLPVKGYIQIALSFGLLAGLIIYAHRHWKWKHWLPSIGTAFIVGGALGNIYERVLNSTVTDFIQVFSWFPIFNFADTFIFIGVCLLIIFEWNINKNKS